jgi:hypothetical protein
MTWRFCGDKAGHSWPVAGHSGAANWRIFDMVCQLLNLIHEVYTKKLVSEHEKNTERQQLASQLLMYMADNPDAEDTFEGIVEWWLLQQRIEYEMNRVKDALSFLVSNHLLIEMSGRDSRVFYRLNKSKLDDIREIIKRSSSNGL